MNTYLCIEILGEPPFHRALNQSGYSGRDYLFFFNAPTRSHLRAYRTLECYLAERVDMHKAANIWPLMPNLLRADQIEPQCWTSPARASTPRKARKGRKEEGAASPSAGSGEREEEAHGNADAAGLELGVATGEPGHAENGSLAL
jgi:hypothetical protein